MYLADKSYMKTKIILSLIVFSQITNAQYNNHDPASAEALQKTQNLLNSPQERNAYIQQNAEAQKANQFAVDNLGSENLNETYALSAEILPYLAKEANNDPQKMMEILSLAKSNPQAFANKLPPNILKKIQDLALKMQSPKAKP